MFSNIRVNSLNISNIVYCNRQFSSGLPDHSRNTILQLRDKILGNQLVYGQDLIKCPSNCCQFVHLYQIFALTRCDCVDIVDQADRDIISIFRSNLDEYIKKDVQEAIKGRNNFTMTFWCSGKLLSELVVMTNVIELIKNLNCIDFKLKINFIDKEYSDYIDASLFEKAVYEITKKPPGEIEPMAVGDIYKERLSRDDAGFARIYKIREMKLINIENNPNRASHIAAINSYLCFLKFILPSSIRTQARFFAYGSDYQTMCVVKDEWHDLLVGHDIQWTWDAMLALHTSTGQKGGRAIAWSKKYEEGKAVGVEIKRMLHEDSNWTRVDETSFSRTYP